VSIPSARTLPWRARHGLNRGGDGSRIARSEKIAGWALFAALAIALVLPSPARAQAPPAQWTGCYAGVEAGGAFGGSASTTDLGNGHGIPYNPPLGNRWSFGLGGGVTAGGVAGCQFQTVSPIVLGLEAEAGRLSLSGSGVAPISPSHDSSAHMRIGDWYAVLAPRLGWSFGNALLYLKAGFAFTEEQAGFDDHCTGFPCGGGAIRTAVSRDETGWAAGTGLEYAIDPRWAVRAEYLYLGVDEDMSSCGIATAGAGTGGTYCFAHHSSGAQTVKLGVVYRFWTPG
jgi:outer membrane immunogenic protein